MHRIVPVFRFFALLKILFEGIKNVGADLFCLFLGKALRILEKPGNELSAVFHRNPLLEIRNHEIKGCRNAVYGMLLYIEDSFCDFQGTIVDFLGPKGLFVGSKIFFVEKLAVKAIGEKYCRYMKAWNAEKMRI